MARAQIETSFPPGPRLHKNYSSSELIGAYGEMNLERDAYANRMSMPIYHPHAGGEPRTVGAGGRPRSDTGPQQPGPSYSPDYMQPVSAIPPSHHTRHASYEARPPPRESPGGSRQSHHSTPQAVTPTGTAPRPTTAQAQQQFNYPTNWRPLHAERPPQQVRYNLPEERVYVPTTVPASNASTSAESRRKYEKLADVYSTSGDTVEFTRNFGDYVSDRCPKVVWVGAVCALMFVGVLFMMFGAFNIPFCNIQPMIPIYLLVAGLLILLSCGLRLFGLIPTPAPAGRRKHLSGALCLHLFEGIFIFVNIIWLILGCVWVYGNKAYVHFNHGMFEEHYCDEGLYWVAFIAVTCQLLFIVIAIVALLILMCLGAYKEADTSDPLE